MRDGMPMPNFMAMPAQTTSEMPDLDVLADDFAKSKSAAKKMASIQEGVPIDGSQCPLLHGAIVVLHATIR